MEFLDYYRENLYYIRGLAAEFAAEFPKIAGRLSLSEFDCQDPYIERLLEGTAFLAAKTEKKLDDGYYGFLESVLNSVSPSSVYPVPSGGVLEVFLKPGNENADAVTLETGTLFNTAIPSINTPCRFSSMETTVLSSYRVSDAQYLLRNLSDFNVKEPDAQSALFIKLSPTGNGRPSIDRGVNFFFSAPEADVSLLFRLLSHDVISVYVRNGGESDGEFVKLSGAEFDLPLSLGGKIFEQTFRSNTRGLRLLQNYLSFPDFFKFFSLKATGTATGMSWPSMDMVVFFKRKETQLLTSVTPGSIKTNCVPVLNIFQKQSDRVAIAKKTYEVHIIPDRTAMFNYEVVNVKKIDFFDERNEHTFTAVNFYEESLAQEKDIRNFFSVKRRNTLVTKTAQRRSSYRGTEVFVSFAPDEEKLENASQFVADLVVTNRDLPLLLQPDALFSSNVNSVENAFFVSPPTRPGLPLIARGNRADYARLSHIVLNLSAMLWQEGSRPLEMFKEMLRAYQVRSQEENEKMISGITNMESENVSFTFIKRGMVFFEWGWRLRFTLDERAFTGMSYYMFARVIAEMLKSFIPVNALLEIEFSTEQSGHIATWKTFED
ncbi:MAG: type VI secretion system baseplate subunit TssF [Spirochaetaceae bacterium]|jgi:type VI secretion system VasI/ImpG family protein|nr:type VI secretion system baseplate subunit TssF [Spirochaetaceae bacterium]